MTTNHKIFAGVRILDVTQYLAGPVAARLFVDLGAEVIKIEPPPKGEGSRALRFGPDDGGLSGLGHRRSHDGDQCLRRHQRRPVSS